MKYECLVVDIICFVLVSPLFSSLVLLNMILKKKIEYLRRGVVVDGVVARGVVVGGAHRREQRLVGGQLADSLGDVTMHR